MGFRFFLEKRGWRIYLMEYISFIGEGTGDKQLLGGKGFYLDRMAKIGLPVPEGFTITTEGYRDWVKSEKQISPDLEQQIRDAVKELEKRTGRGLGKREAPLLVSVRSGAPVSMPGMMETVLNVGATNESIAGLAEQNQQNTDFAYRTYRNFMQQYMAVVHRNDMIDMEQLASRVTCPKLLLYVGDTFVKRLQTEKDVKKKFLENNQISLCPLGKHEVMYALSSLHGFRLTGSHVSEMSYLSRDEIRRGKIALVTEDYLKILWDGGTFEEIPYTVMEKSAAHRSRKKMRTISLYPQLYLEAEQYLTELQSVGQLIPDTLKIRRQLVQIPEDPFEQIFACVESVFASWEGYNAQTYREANNIPANLGTAITIQHMVFGNIGSQSGTAVCFSSCPKTGDRKLSGEYLKGYQGESLVSGQKTPENIATLREKQPRVYERLEQIAAQLEKQYGAIQDIEATWENPEKVYVLQTRNALLSSSGKVGFVLRQYHDGILKERDIIVQLDVQDIEHIANSVSLEIPSDIQPLTRGKGIVDGIVVGRLALTKDEVHALKEESIVYCRQKITADDICEIRKSAAVFTAEGGEYSHAAVVARGMNKVALVGCEGMSILQSSVFFGSEVVKAGSLVTVDGYNGVVYRGVQKVNIGRASPLVAEITRIARSVVADLPVVYYAQHPDDLKSIPEGGNTQLVYSLDFALLQDSGILEKRGEESFQREALHVYDALQERVSEIVLVYEGIFDKGYKNEGHDPVLMQQSFLEALSVHGNNEKDTLYISKDNVRLQNSGIKGIQFCDALPFKTGQNCVLIKPWAVDESYFIAAKEAMQQ